MLIWEGYMSVIAFVGSSAYYMQAYKLYKRKAAKDLSIQGYLISLFTSANWLIYGLIIKDVPLVFSGMISTIGAGLVIAGILSYS